MSKKQKLFNDNYEEQLFNYITVSDDHDQESQEVEPTVDESSFIDEECVDEECAVIDTYTITLTLQESWFLIKALRLYIQNTSCLQRSKL